MALILFALPSCGSGLVGAEAVPCSVQAMGWILWKRLTSLWGWLSWQVISSLQAQLAEAQSSQEAQLREELQRADQEVQHRALRVKEYEREVGVGFVLPRTQSLTHSVLRGHSRAVLQFRKTSLPVAPAAQRAHERQTPGSGEGAREEDGEDARGAPGGAGADPGAVPGGGTACAGLALQWVLCVRAALLCLTELFPCVLARAGAQAEVGAAGGAAGRGGAAAAAPRHRGEGAAGRAGGEAERPAAEAQGEGEHQALPLALGILRDGLEGSPPCPLPPCTAQGDRHKGRSRSPGCAFLLGEKLVPFSLTQLLVQERKLQDSEKELEIRMKSIQARSEHLLSQVSRPVGLTELP